MIRYLPRCGGVSFCIRVYKNGGHVGNIRQTQEKKYYFRPTNEDRCGDEFSTIREMKTWLERKRK